MNNNRSSLITWGIVIGMIIFAAILSATWPLISAQLPTFELGGLQLGGDGPALPPPESETAPIDLDFIPFEPIQSMSLPPLLAMAVLAGLILGPVIVGGVVLAFLFRLLSRQATQTLESEPYQESQRELEKRETARLKALREAQPADPIPNHQRPRWSAVSTGLIIIFFLIYLGNALANTFVPGGQIERGDQVISLTQWIVLGLIAVGVLIALFTLRPQKIIAVDQEDNMPIPWGTIWVILTGVIMLGAGTGLMLILMN